MTGGGFGGCTVSIVESAALETFREKVSARYRELCGLECEIYTASPADGARELL